MGKHEQIIAELEIALNERKEKSEKIIDQMEYAIGLCKTALNRMRKVVVIEGFSSQSEEIYFFKKLKPSVYSKLLYFQSIFELESNRPMWDDNGIKNYLTKSMEKLSDYMIQNQIRVQYYRCNFEHFDEKYFTRGHTEIPLEIRNFYHLMDEDFFTWHDHTFSMIMANEMLIEYIRLELEKLDKRVELNRGHYKSSLNWTGHKIDLGEIIYALKYSGAVDNGNATIRDLAEAFEQIFNVEIKEDIYFYRIEIQERKIEKLKFLNQLIKKLQHMIDEKDG